MRIVIEVDGEKVTSMSSDAVPSMPRNVGDALPGPPPPALLERAKKLGAMSAGAAQFGRGTALASTVQFSETPKPSRRAPRKKAANKRRK
jgi:hypothetical protein